MNFLCIQLIYQGTTIKMKKTKKSKGFDTQKYINIDSQNRKYQRQKRK